MRYLEGFKHYICGLVDGEGSFSISVQVDPTHKNGLRLRPAFSIGLHRDDKQILRQVEQFFECGKFREVNRIIKYEVAKLEDLVKIILPFFTKYPLRAKKKEDFKIFSDICFLMKQKKHLNQRGFDKIINMRTHMNLAGKRRKLLFEKTGGVAQLVRNCQHKISSN